VSDGDAIIVDPFPLTQDHPVLAGSGSATQPLVAQPSAPGTLGESAPITPTVRPAGWYRSAANPDEVRYWDGSQWTTAPDDPAVGPTTTNGRGDLGGVEPHIDPVDDHGYPDAAGRPAAPAVSANWYPDPADRTRLRYWDGLGWTEQVLDERPSPRP
jgi:hypothetical protein